VHGLLHFFDQSIVATAKEFSKQGIKHEGSVLDKGQEKDEAYASCGVTDRRLQANK
jgi:hypothetical protein